MPGDDDNAYGQGLVRRTVPWLVRADHLLYLAVALILLFSAVGIVVHALAGLSDELDKGFPHAVSRLVNEALFVLIVLELLGTVREYLATGTVSVRVFIYVGIISAIRRIIAIGGLTSVGEDVVQSEFNNLMVDLGVNAAVVLALAISLYLVGRQFPRGQQPDARAVGQAPAEGANVSA